MLSGPLLSLAPLLDGRLVTGGVDGSVRMLSMETSSVTTLGQHQVLMASNLPKDKVACSCLGSVPTMGHDVVVSAGWHRQLHLYDVRQSMAGTSVNLPGKAFSMDIDPTRPRCVIATSNRRIVVIDFRWPGTQMTLEDQAQGRHQNEDFHAEVVMDRESSLKYQTRVVRFFPNGTGIAVGSIEGRVGIEYLEELNVMAPPNSKKFAFKCHRNGDVVFPVNCIDFHPRFGTFATGGSDCTVGTSLSAELKIDQHS
jgi:WD40 repeat protein